MSSAQEEVHITESLVGEHGECLGGDLEAGLALKLSCAHAFFREEIILGVIFAQLEHGRILEFWCCCHISCRFNKRIILDKK